MASILAYMEESTRLQAERLANTKVRYELELVDLTKNSFEAFWTVDTVNLSIPRQIDYETLSAS